MQRFFSKIKNKAGYTIIETMIAVSLFLVVVTISMGALLNANLLHQKSQNMRSILDSLSFIMEDMSRNLRTGYHYHCFAPGDTIPNVSSVTMSTPKSAPKCWAIAFETANGVQSNNDDQWVYYIGDDGVDHTHIRIYKSTQGPYLQSSFIQLTPDEVNIDPNASSFAVMGAEAGASDPALNQPFVIIRLVGSITLNKVVTPFSLQTSVSQRVLDI